MRSRMGRYAHTVCAPRRADVHADSSGNFPEWSGWDVRKQEVPKGERRQQGLSRPEYPVYSPAVLLDALVVTMQESYLNRNLSTPQGAQDTEQAEFHTCWLCKSSTGVPKPLEGPEQITAEITMAIAHLKWALSTCQALSWQPYLHQLTHSWYPSYEAGAINITIPIIYVFILAVLGLLLCGLFSSWSALTSHCSGFSCGAWALGPWVSVAAAGRLSSCAWTKVALRHGMWNFSWTRDQTHVPCIGRWILI